jgi:hypothetical protein
MRRLTLDEACEKVLKELEAYPATYRVERILPGQEPRPYTTEDISQQLDFAYLVRSRTKRAHLTSICRPNTGYALSTASLEMAKEGWREIEFTWIPSEVEIDLVDQILTTAHEALKDFDPSLQMVVTLRATPDAETRKQPGWREIGKNLNGSHEAARKCHRRAIQHITNYMNAALKTGDVIISMVPRP